MNPLRPAPTLLALLTLIALALPAMPAVAEDGLDAWERNFSLRFSATEPGTIRIIGNANLTCDETFTPDTCLDAREGTATGSANNNNQHWMRMVDVDGDPTTFNSSSADFLYRGLGANAPGAGGDGDSGGVIGTPGPAPPQVLWAGLYWAADLNRRAFSGREGEVAPDQEALDEVLLRPPGHDAYLSVTADECSLRSPSAAQRDYICFADVSDLLPDDPGGTWTLANLQTGQGSDRYAGWGLVLVIADPAEPTRNLSVFDGVRRVSTGNEATLTVSGFLTPPFGPVRTQLGVVAWEGDRAQIGSRFVLEGTELSDPLRPANNFLNTSITAFGEAVIARNPSYDNTMGLDIGLIETTGLLPNDAEEATIELQTTAGTYFTGAVTFATEIFAPQPRLLKSVTNLAGGDARPDDRLRYTLALSNEGFDAATDLLLLDSLAAPLLLDQDSVLVGGSADATFTWDEESRTLSFPLPDLLPGETITVSFDVLLGDAVSPGEVISNQAALDYRAQTLERDLRRLSSADPERAGIPTTFRVTDAPPALRLDSPADGALLATLRPTLEGQTDPDATLTLLLRTLSSSDELTLSPPLSEDGSWTWTPPSDLAETTWQVELSAEDRIGNRAAIEPRTFTLDVTPPPLTLEAPEADALLFTQRPTIRGISEVGATITLRVDDGDGAELWSAEIGTNSEGAWSTTPDALGDGERSVRVSAEDAAGNRSTLPPRPFSIDTRAPLLIWDTPADTLVTDVQAPPFAGRTDSDATLLVTLARDGQPSRAPEPIPVDGTTGAFVWTPDEVLDEGGWSALLVAARPNGRETGETRRFTIDRTPEPTDPEPSDGDPDDSAEPSDDATEPPDSETETDAGSETKTEESSGDGGPHHDTSTAEESETSPGADAPSDPVGQSSDGPSAGDERDTASGDEESSGDRGASAASGDGCGCASTGTSPFAPAWTGLLILLVLSGRRRHA